MFLNQEVFNEIRVAVLGLFMGTDKNSDTEGRTDGRTDSRGDFNMFSV